MGLYSNNNNNNLELLGTTPYFLFFFAPLMTVIALRRWTKVFGHVMCCIAPRLTLGAIWQMFIDYNRDLCIVQATPALRSCVRSIAKPKAQGLRPSHRSSCSSSNSVASLKTPLKSASMKMASCEFHSPLTRTEGNAKSHTTDFKREIPIGVRLHMSLGNLHCSYHSVNSFEERLTFPLFP